MKIRILSDSHENAERLRASLAGTGSSMDIAVGHATSSEPLGAVNGTVRTSSSSTRSTRPTSRRSRR